MELWAQLGNVTGIHLHLELSTTMAWDYDTFLNPSTALGIPNERGTKVTCLKIVKKENQIWLEIPSGFICAKYGDKVYVK